MLLLFTSLYVAVVVVIEATLDVVNVDVVVVAAIVVVVIVDVAASCCFYLAQDMRLPMIVITDMQHDGSGFGAVFCKYVE